MVFFCFRAWCGVLRVETLFRRRRVMVFGRYGSVATPCTLLPHVRRRLPRRSDEIFLRHLNCFYMRALRGNHSRSTGQCKVSLFSKTYSLVIARFCHRVFCPTVIATTRISVTTLKCFMKENGHSQGIRP